MIGQITLDEWLKSISDEPNIGDWFETHGAEIPSDQWGEWVGRLVMIDKSTQNHAWYQVGRLEKIYPHQNGTRLMIYIGTRQRNFLDTVHRPKIYAVTKERIG